jgi:hypothetical protein
MAAMQKFRRMPSYGMICRVSHIRTDVSEERSTSIIRVIRIGEVQLFLRNMRQLLVTANAVPSSPILVTLVMEALLSSKSSDLNKSHVV